jgi:sporulation protein YhbH
MRDFSFTIAHEDWNLHREADADRLRLNQRIHATLQHQLAEIILDERLIGSERCERIRIPLRNLEEWHFRYDPEQSEHLGQGDGNSKLGDIVFDDNRVAVSSFGSVRGSSEASDEHDLQDADISIEQVEDVLFENWQLPGDDSQRISYPSAQPVPFAGITRYGIQANLDRKRTLVQMLKRRSTARNPAPPSVITNEDLRYKSWTHEEQPEPRAVILAMMDISTSMGTFEKYCARSFFFWLTRFLRRNYPQVEIIHIAHHSTAQVVSEQDFYNRKERGGTRCSSAYQLALQLINTYDAPSSHHIYPFHLSDGDTANHDAERCSELICELLRFCPIFGYVEVNRYHRTSTFMSAVQQLREPDFIHTIMRQKSDLLAALRTFFLPTHLAGRE